MQLKKAIFFYFTVYFVCGRKKLGLSLQQTLVFSTLFIALTALREKALLRKVSISAAAMLTTTRSVELPLKIIPGFILY